jgi:hypothetical protein
MHEKSDRYRLIDAIVDRTYDHSDLQGRTILREKLNKKSLGELQEIWERETEEST